MKMIKTFTAALLISALVLSSCGAQSKLKPFTKLVYRSSFCFGSCPRLDMQIDNNRNIYVERQFFHGKAQPDTAGSGQFAGVLDEPTYNALLDMLVKTKYDEVEWPGVTCCDGVITTLIVYAKDKRTYLKSMTPPEEARPLVALLRKIALETQLQRTDKKMELEN